MIQSNKAELYYTLNTHKIGNFTDVLNYCIKICTILNTSAPITFKTGILGLKQFEKILNFDLLPYIDINNKETVTIPLTGFNSQSYEEIKIGYNKFLDHFVLEARSFQGLPISSGNIEFYIDDNAIATFQTNIDI
jgi:hypothetical protein